MSFMSLSSDEQRMADIREAEDAVNYERKSMYTVSVTLLNKDTKFMVAGISNIHTEIVSEKHNPDGSRHECNIGDMCPVPTTHIFKAKSKDPFVAFIGSKAVVATNENGIGARFLVRDGAGFFHDMEVSERQADFVIF